MTNRLLCKGDFLEQIEKIAVTKEYIIILREKDLSADEYMCLAKNVMGICDKYGADCILHYFIDICKKLSYKKIHVPLYLLEENPDMINDFDVIGVSVHSADEAIKAEKLGATYITAGHIFATDCKKGVPPRGIEFLKTVCNSVNIPVYAIGGIDENNIDSIKNIADGACQMSTLMNM